MLREVSNNLFQYASNIRGYGTRYAAKQNLYKFGVRTDIGRQSLSFIAIDIWKDFPFSINSRTFAVPKLVKHYLLCEQQNKIIH